jgi:hypothetical protein
MQYVDMSDLNAQYDHMPIRGIGTVHSYTDVSKLNAPYAQFPPLQGIGAGVLSGGPLGSLGLGQTYPWHQYSDDTKELQELVNEALEEHGYCPIEEDGKLGGDTCGAIKLMLEITGQTDQSPPAACQSFVTPKSGPCPGDLVGPRRGAISDTTWLLGGGIVAAVAIGAAIFMKKKRR